MARDEMSFSDDFMNRLRKACAEAVDAESIARVLGMFTGDEEWKASLLWTGPAFADDLLLLDVNILTPEGLINYWVRSDGSDSINCTRLGAVSAVAVLSVHDERSPYVLSLRGDQSEKGRIFSKDREELVSFARDFLKVQVESSARR